MWISRFSDEPQVLPVKAHYVSVETIKPVIASLFCLLVCACSVNAVGGILISEFMASNTGGLTDQDGDTSDWIEIHNDSLTQTNLAGWHLTDDAANLSKWTFPATNVPAGGYVVVFASGKNRTVSG